GHRDLRGAAHHARLGARLEEARLVQQMIERDQLARRVTALTLRVERVDPTEQARIELARADRVVDSLATLEQTRQDLVDVADRERVVRAVMLDRSGGTGAPAIPHLLHRIPVAAEEDVLALRPARHEHGDRFGLREAGEVIEVAVLTIAERRVAA